MSARIATYIAGAALAGLATTGIRAHAQSARFEVSVAPSAYSGPLTGRLVIVVSKQEKPEPRLAIGPRGPAVFAVDLQQLAPGHAAIVASDAASYPLDLAALPPGDYYVQAVVNVYEHLHRSDGHDIWAHMGDGRVEFFNFAAGNLYSDVQHVRVAKGTTVHLTVSHVIPESPRPADTEWLKHVTIQSQLLT